jgi:hypothetical protein
MYLILENDPHEVPPTLRHLLDTRFKGDHEIIFNFSEKGKNDPEFLLNKLLALQEGDSIVGETNLHEDDQIEKVMMVLGQLMAKGVRVKFSTVFQHEVYGSMADAFNVYQGKETCHHTPEGMEPLCWKTRFNEIIHKVINFHQLSTVSSENPDEDLLLVSNGHTFHMEQNVSAYANA